MRRFPGISHLLAAMLLLQLVSFVEPSLGASPELSTRAEPTSDPLRFFDLPADTAEKSLKRFAQESGRDVLFPTEAVENIRTRAIRGRMSSREALARMLVDTDLEAVQDSPNGPFTVTRRHPPASPEPVPMPPQLPPGMVRGRVKNQVTKLYLEGAVVRAPIVGIQSTTERGGNYQLILPPGRHIVTFFYTGLTPLQIALVVESGESTVQDVDLTSEIYALDEYTVAGNREGSALAITLQRGAPSLKNVVAVDHFGRPAANPGDLLQRLPGVVGDITGSEVRSLSIRGAVADLNSTTIDGNRTADAGSAGPNRGVQMQHLGTYNVEAVELIKVPTPDMSADSIGGTVNLITKSILDRPGGRQLNYSQGTTYRYWENASPLYRDTLGIDELSLGYSERLGTEQNFGLTFNLGYRTPIVHVDEVYHEYQVDVPDPNAPRFQRVFSHRDFTANERRLSGGFRLDWQIGDATRAYLSAHGSKRSEYMKIRRFYWQTDLAGTAIRPGSSYVYTEAQGSDDSQVALRSQSIDKHGGGYTVNPGVVHRLGPWSVDYDAFISRSETKYPNLDSFDVTVRGIGASIDRRATSDWYPAWTQLSGPDVYDLDSYTANTLLTSEQYASDSIAGGKINVRRDFSTALPAYFKFGLKHQQEVRRFHRVNGRYSFLGEDAVMGLNPASQANDDQLGRFEDTKYTYAQVNGRYAPLPFPGIPNRGHGFDVKAALRSDPHLFSDDVYYRTSQTHLWDRELKERISAAYLMGGIEVGRLAATAGLRAERTRVQGTGALNLVTAEEKARRDAYEGDWARDPAEQQRRAQEQFGRRVTSRGAYQSIFPGVHLKYNASANLLLRASYSTSIGRPAPSHLIPNDTVDLENRLILRSNPGLQPQKAQTYDLSAEYYFEPVGLFSLGFFSKDVRKFAFSEVSKVPAGPENGFDGEYAEFDLRIPRNGGSARIRGIEVNYQQQFNFMPGWLAGFGAYANYTLLDAKGDFGGGRMRTTDEIPHFVPRSANAGITYRFFGLSAALHATHVGRFLIDYSTDPNRVLYRASRTTVEFRSKYSLRSNLEIYFDVYNIFNEPVRPTVRGRGLNYPGNSNKEGVLFAAGLSGRF